MFLSRSNLFLGILAISGAAASGQTILSNLATNTDASTILFVGNNLQPRGTKPAARQTTFQLPGQRVFKLTDAGISEVELPTAPDDSGTLTVGRPSISGDGTKIATNASFIARCTGQTCTPVPAPLGHLDAGGTTSDFMKNIDLSPNGKYAALYGGLIPVEGTTNQFRSAPLSRLVLDSQTVTEIGMPVTNPLAAARGNVIADDGSVLALVDSKLSLVHLDGTNTTLTRPSGLVNDIQLSADARRIVYWLLVTPGDTQNPPKYEVHVIDVATDTDRLVAEGQNAVADTAANSAVFIRNTNTQPGNPNQIWIADLNAQTTALVADYSEGVTDAVVSGNGRFILASLATGRILKIDLWKGTTTDALKSVGPSSHFLWSAVPGSYNELLSSPAPDPSKIEVWVGDYKAPLLGMSVRGLGLQIPWEVKPAPNVNVVLRGESPELEQVLPVGTETISPDILPVAQDSLSGPWYFAVHENWSGPVRYDNPARPGELLHMFAIGLGPVNGTLQTGQPTPADRPYVVPTTGTCTAQPGDKPFDLLFAGLAPGLTGLYQIDVRIPSDWDQNYFIASCPPLFSTDIARKIPVQP